MLTPQRRSSLRPSAVPGGGRPDASYAKSATNAKLAWPVKLTLVQQLAERVADLLRADGVLPTPAPGAETLPLPAPQVARPPWLDAFG